jgi:hypothetical protein
VQPTDETETINQNPVRGSITEFTVQLQDETATTDQNPKGSTTIAVGTTYG